VRDLRVRWALEEADLTYRVASVPFEHRSAEHLAHQPFTQVPWLTDGDLSIFESGAILLHIGGQSEALMPADRIGKAETTQWLLAALNSVEIASLPWSVFIFSNLDTEAPHWQLIDGFLKLRLGQLEQVLVAREWLIGRFTVADIAMADVLRLVDRLGGLSDLPACHAYVARATARPAFRKALDAQLAHFAAGDATRGES
jgi:glutathione S-transferase